MTAGWQRVLNVIAFLAIGGAAVVLLILFKVI